jgi:hypothetical protein
MDELQLPLKFNACLDDGKLIARHEDLRCALNYIHLKGPALGLVLNLSKCSVWWPTRNEAELEQCNEDIQRISSEEGGTGRTQHAIFWYASLDNMPQIQELSERLEYSECFNACQLTLQNFNASMILYRTPADA